MSCSRGLVLAVATLALGLAGCGDDDEETTAQKPATTARTATQAQAEPVPASAAPQAEHTTFRRPAFRMPSRNIGCQMAGSTVRCDIRRRDWDGPRRPASCDLEWGDAIEVSGRRRASFLCHGDTAFDQRAPILAYGSDSRVGSMRCQSRTAGVTCRSEVSGHGFFMARDRYRLF